MLSHHFQRLINILGIHTIPYKIELLIASRKGLICYVRIYQVDATTSIMHVTKIKQRPTAMITITRSSALAILADSLLLILVTDNADDSLFFVWADLYDSDGVL